MVVSDHSSAQRASTLISIINKCYLQKEQTFDSLSFPNFYFGLLSEEVIKGNMFLKPFLGKRSEESRQQLLQN